ncbi:hypothetical protein [Acetobacter indonesiensis]|uniref:hypothetical protein n=1 Tax=Acetobacter indonesiensis TaxID=104101 RepID=UPI0039EC3AE7
MTPTNWPDPAREGYPLFSGNNGKHTLIDKNTGHEINAEWNSADDEWLMPDSWLSAKNTAKHFAYLRCDTVELTRAQIAEMLAAERERCAVALDRLKNKESEMYGVGLMTARAEITIRAFASGAEAIRNLGAAP